MGLASYNFLFNLIYKGGPVRPLVGLASDNETLICNGGPVRPLMGLASE